MPTPGLLTEGGGIFSTAARDAINALISSQGVFTQGHVYWVRPRTGSDFLDGLSPASALKTVAAALANATAGQNDVIVLCAEGNAAADTTDYQGATLTWNKDLVHLIGIGAGPLYSQRARLAFVSTYAAATPLLSVTANDCLFYGIEMFMGVAQAQPLGCVKVTGQRNVFRRCQIAGIGAVANDIAGAYSLNLSGAEECVLEDCTIGLDTIVRALAANCEILVDTASTRNQFTRCRIVSLVGHATNHPQVRLTGATAIDRTLIFEDCKFINLSVNYAFAQATIFKMSALLTQGLVMLYNPINNPSDASTAVPWDVDNHSRIALFNAPTPAAVTAGLAKMA